MTVDQDDRTITARVLELQRTFVTPPELTGSRPRDVALTAAGKALFLVAAASLFHLG